MMKILARIPSLEPLRPSCAATACAPAVQSPPPSEPSAAPSAPLPRPAESKPVTRRRGRSGPRFPIGSVAALAVVAAVAWSLASWNDGRRAEHSRLERLARMQMPPTPTGTVAR